MTHASAGAEHLAVSESCRLSVRAVPNAPTSRVVGWVEDTLRVKVHAPALEGRANEELCEFLASELGVRRGSVRVVQGAKSRLKVVEIHGLSAAEVRARLRVSS
ncbi:MAG: DUF167 domain-containing protein [Opitutaceae bacterium]